MGETLRPDICVIGGGSGGLSVAAGAAAFGVDVVLIERGRMGGDCLNYGCVPSKSLIAAARHAAAIRRAPRFGISAGAPAVDFGAVRAHVRGVVEALAPHDSVARFTALGVRVIEASARFVDPRTVEAGGIRVAARRFVIATGSSPRVLPVPGLADVPFLTNETVFDLETLPGHLLVIGGGPIGMELAQAFRRLGSGVTVVDDGRAMRREDPELAAVLLERVAGEGARILAETKVLAAARTPGGVELALEGAGGARSRVSGTHLLLAAGRIPNVADLGLDAAGVAHDARGVRVGRTLRTGNRRIYAIGDAAGGPQFTHLAGHHAGLVLRSILFRLPARQAPDLVPRVTYTDPELGQVGLTEGEARERGLSFRVVSSPYGASDRARADAKTDGLLKLVVGRRGRLLGAGVVGEAAGELTNLFSLALSKSMTMRDLQGFLSPYPTYGEIGKRAATAYYAPYAQQGLVRGLVRLLARFG